LLAGYRAPQVFEWGFDPASRDGDESGRRRTELERAGPLCPYCSTLGGGLRRLQSGGILPGTTTRWTKDNEGRNESDNKRQDDQKEDRAEAVRRLAGVRL